MFEIRAGRESDKPQILELIKEIFGSEPADRTARRWDWQWHQDPRLLEPGFRSVVAEWNGRVIANLSCIPAGLFIDGKPVEAYWYADALTHWGSVRQALREQKRAGQAGGLKLPRGIAAVMLDHPAAGVMQLGKHLTDPMTVVAYKIGSTDQPVTGSWSRLISFRQPLERYFGKLLAMPVAFFVDLIIPRVPQPGMAVKTLTGDFDARFDGLWEQARNEYQAITRRDRATLNWRYRQHPDTAYQVLTVEDHEGLRGYLIYSVFYRHQQRRAHILDMLASHRDTAVLEALIAEALHQLRRQSVHRVECYAGGLTAIAALEHMGFKPRLHNGKVQCTLVRGIPPLDELYITRGDGDGG